MHDEDAGPAERLFGAVRRGVEDVADRVPRSWGGAVAIPLTAAFLTVLFLLAGGDRAAIEAVVGPAGSPPAEPPSP